MLQPTLRWLTIVFWPHTSWFRKSCNEVSFQTLHQSCASHRKMLTNMASKFVNFVYRKCCVDRLQFQNIYWLNRWSYLSLLDLKEKCTCTKYAGVPTNEADLFDRHDHWAGQSKVVYYLALQSLALFVEQTKAKIWVRMLTPLQV